MYQNRTNLRMPEEKTKKRLKRIMKANRTTPELKSKGILPITDNEVEIKDDSEGETEENDGNIMENAMKTTEEGQHHEKEISTVDPTPKCIMTLTPHSPTSPRSPQTSPVMQKRNKAMMQRARRETQETKDMERLEKVKIDKLDSSDILDERI